MIRIKKELIESLTEAARRSSRKRMNYNLHKSMDENVQRFFNAFETDSYVRPHRHVQPGRFELFLCIRGKGAAIIFADDANITDTSILSPGGECIGVEIPDNTWHTIIALSPDTVFFEVKEGPYMPIEDKDFAPWAPDAADPGHVDYLKNLREAILLRTGN